MASGAQGPKQSHGFFVPLGNCVPSMLQYSGGAGAGGSYLPGSFTAADWATTGANGARALLSTISSVGQGGMLRDMGRTVVSSNRTFRKVQLVTPSLNEGITGSSSTSGPYLTAYIELSWGHADVSNTAAAPVAYLPGLL